MTEARVVRNPATGESRGFGFVAMDHDDDVDAVRRPKSPQTCVFMDNCAFQLICSHLIVCNGCGMVDRH